MSNVLNGLESNSGHIANGSASHSNPVPIPLSYFIPNPCLDANLKDKNLEFANSEDREANREKVPLNNTREPVSIRQELAQLRADFAQKDAQRSAEIQVLRARLAAQEAIIADGKGTIRALETQLREFVQDQAARMDGFEQTYQTDKIQTSRLQQASNKQLEDRLQSMVDAMLSAAVEKAIRLFKRDRKPVPTPARRSSTPCLDHLYETKVYQRKRTA